ncbi:hypothetical protein [Catenulispora rubra]|uniref:hypothetical protein n=1 Tax=Catenulispora rubra TaxID=280293 RepID=UPI001E422FD4|nr:hypothetical protein [Catenulispora rubra]
MTSETVTVVLAHGAWADGSSWGKVIGALEAAGVRTIAAQLPLTSRSRASPPPWGRSTTS